MKQILMSCGVQGDKGFELDRGQIYAVGVTVSEELAAELVRRNAACYLPEIEEAPIPETEPELLPEPTPADSEKKGGKNARR